MRELLNAEADYSVENKEAYCGLLTRVEEEVEAKEVEEEEEENEKSRSEESLWWLVGINLTPRGLNLTSHKIIYFTWRRDEIPKILGKEPDFKTIRYLLRATQIWM